MSNRLRIQKLKQDFPWTKAPLISNAPMGGIATSNLAIEVSKCGGLGQIGFSGSVYETQKEMKLVAQSLKGVLVTDTLPVGIGIICLDNDFQPWLPLFRQHRPAMVWLSFGSSQQFSRWTKGIREVSPRTKIWIQLGDVSSALEAGRLCQPDALVLQGSDAGGHGHVHGASLITLVPEVVDALEQAAISDIPLIAAGGIMDGRSAAAAILLGASGVVMGTRYLGAKEARFDADFREEIFSTADGGRTTVRSRVFDDIWGRNFWPQEYDGRCVRGAIYNHYKAGMSIEEIATNLNDGSGNSDPDKVPVRDVACIWAGTGIGMVRKLENAGDITVAIRDDARDILGGGNSLF